MIANQKLFLNSKAVIIIGNAIIFPTKQTIAFIIGFFYPNLSQIIPPSNDDENPQISIKKGKIVKYLDASLG